ncbi:Clp protease N-terminal domain-containing protein [Amycolatopsis alkalitolerans]|uniref:Clp protease n=1 Tax=Amycolatopsis alkalitolerans TaxID=2547244 RepID=A0A5C4MCC6_9PSEU|nr:Clp protease N-terminal domain-containing protein [Amycolatopsis alkalitolerans]TNC29082.1 Clp protease [Amycolatopsis alkalitolerans]
MMFERFTPDARAVVVEAQEHARRLGHRYLGCEHLLLAVAGTGEPASAVLREYGIIPDHVEEEIVRRTGLGGGAGLFSDLDANALSAIGIDLDAVRARIEASFGADALTRAAEAMDSRPRRVFRRGLLSRRRRRAVLAASAPRPAVAGRYQSAGPVPRGHLPFTTRAKKSLENSVHEAIAGHDQHIGVEHLALALIGMRAGLVPPILEALGASAPAVRAAILDRHRRAG